MSTKPLCSVTNCGRETLAKGLCYAHYRRMRRGADLEAPIGERGLVEVPGPRVREEVANMLKTVAAAQGITEYEIIRRIIYSWYENIAATSNKKPVAK
jgi:hypothetical protein